MFPESVTCTPDNASTSMTEQEHRLLLDYRSLDRVGQDFVRHAAFLALRVHGLHDDRSAHSSTARENQ